MSRSQSVLLFVLIGAIVTGVILTRPAGRSSAGGFLFPLATVPSQNELITPSPGTMVPAAAASLAVTPTLAQQPYELGLTPEAFFAIELPTQQAGAPSADDSTAVPGWNPPGMEVPIAIHPFDHYWLIRPVAPNANNESLPHYAFGSDGPANDLRIHHGVDIANPIGVEVLAAADGVVVSAGRGEAGDEVITAYGYTVVIQHDFGYNGEAVYTLYAHLSAIFVEEQQRVESGQVIGLIGNTGVVTGSHVHFEVRIGQAAYDAVRNPDLWIAPYVGTGVIAGHILLDDGTPAYDATILLFDVETKQEIYRTTTYASSSVSSDDNWGETFTIPDIPAGRYVVRARHDYGTWVGEVEVLPGTTNWVNMVRTSRASNNPTPTPTP